MQACICKCMQTMHAHILVCTCANNYTSAGYLMNIAFSSIVLQSTCMFNVAYLLNKTPPEPISDE